MTVITYQKLIIHLKGKYKKIANQLLSHVKYAAVKDVSIVFQSIKLQYLLPCSHVTHLEKERRFLASMGVMNYVHLSFLSSVHDASISVCYYFVLI